ncbi:MAG: methylenetetrahydrofolate reductase [NAD(P)H] [Chitinispirillaceae bacterium]|nr:methylenetetrahydrofolate reductase [NAD(P)H] [Chitinispirillaceae bacterium]
MHLKEIFKQNKKTFSFEFFPPKDTKSSDTLFRSIAELVPLKPAYVSVTYGAGGSTRELTRDLVVRIRQSTDLTVVAHLTCVGSTREELRRILATYVESGIENIFAISGDPPADAGDSFSPPPDGCANAVELVALIKRFHPALGIGVAGFPEGHKRTPNRLTELDYLKAKIDAGADYICTQLFFDNHEFYDFRDRCDLAGIRVPIIAGIMPVTSRKGMLRMAELSPFTRFPARLLKALGRSARDDQFEKVGIHWATEQIMDLIDNKVRGVHFYTLNRSRATLSIYDALGVTDSQGLV